MKRNVVYFPDRAQIEKEASEWIVRFEEGEPPTQRDVNELKAWIARSPKHREIMMRYASLWNDMDLLTELAMPLARNAKPNASFVSGLLVWILSTAARGIAVLSKPRKVLSPPKKAWIALAVVLILSTLGVFALSVIVFEQTSRNGIYVTSTGERRTIALPDGSTIWLNTRSKVEVSYSNAKRRIVLNNGEAYFKVAKNSLRPFEVYAGSRMVRAVGTAFSVYRGNNSVNVTVTEGRVDLAIVKSLSSTESIAGVADTGVSVTPVPAKSQNSTEEDFTQLLGSLVAGQSVNLSEDDPGFMENVRTHEQRELDQRLSWRDGLLIFSGESLQEVVEEVSRYTVLKIRIADPELKSIRVGGQFKVGETEALFDVLENGFGLQVSRLDDNHVEILTRK